MSAFDLGRCPAIVSGAFSGLGLHFARVLAAHGAKLAWGGRRIVVNNAGSVARARNLEVTEEAWNALVDVKLSGVFWVAQATARAMIDAHVPGSILNIASILGLRVRAQVASYAARKAAVVQLRKALALERAEHGIQVDAIAPGFFQTDIKRDLLRSDVGRAIVARVPQ